MEDSFVAHVSDWLSIAGFFITLVTLFMTLNIRGKIEQTMRRQRFQQQGDRIYLKLKRIRDEVHQSNEYDKPVRKFPSPTLLCLRELTLQLIYFKLWNRSEHQRMRRFVHQLEQAASPKAAFPLPKKYTAKDLIMGLDEIIAIVESRKEL